MEIREALVKIMNMKDGYYWVHEKGSSGNNIAMRFSHSWYVFHIGQNEHFINDRDMTERYEILEGIEYR